MACTNVLDCLCMRMMSFDFRIIEGDKVLSQDVAMLNSMRALWARVNDGNASNNDVKRKLSEYIEVLENRQLPDNHPKKTNCYLTI